MDSSHRLPWALAFHHRPMGESFSSEREEWEAVQASSRRGRKGSADAHADNRNAFWVAYLKRRRRLHTAAHEYYVWLTNVIMLPALLTSAVASVLAVTLKDMAVGPWVVAAVATTSTFLIGVQQHLKVEAKAESHRISAHRYDHLVTEAVSRSIITGITVRDVAEWEKELHRIAEANQFVLPARIRRMHGAADPHLSHGRQRRAGEGSEARDQARHRWKKAAVQARLRAAVVAPTWEVGQQARPSQSASATSSEAAPRIPAEARVPQPSLPPRGLSPPGPQPSSCPNSREGDHSRAGPIGSHDPAQHSPFALFPPAPPRPPRGAPKRLSPLGSDAGPKPNPNTELSWTCNGASTK